MAKIKLKEKKIKQQKGRTKKGKKLPDKMSLIDTHRIVPRMEGGKYTDENYIVLLPKEHMQEHGNYKERTEELDRLKMLYDGYKQIQKLRMKINNQLLAEERQTDSLDEIDVEYIKEVMNQIKDKEKEKEKQIKKWVKQNKNIPIVKALLSVNGVGEVLIASLLTYIEIEKAEHPSSLWSYVGYHIASHKRFEKLPEKSKQGKWYSTGNRTLRCQLYITAGVFIKCSRFDNPYAKIYYTRKEKTKKSSKITQTRITGKKGIHSMAWKDVSDGHRHGDAQRVMMKHFLADLWFVWRTLEGLPTNDLYVKEHLGHQSAIIEPKKRGWIY